MSPSINPSPSPTHSSAGIVRCPFDATPVEPTRRDTRRLLVAVASFVAFASFGTGFAASYLAIL